MDTFYSATADAFRFREHVVDIGLYVGAHILNADTGIMYQVTREVAPYTYHITPTDM